MGEQTVSARGIELPKLNQVEESFVVGGVAAMISKTCAAPIERVKLILQNQEAMLKSGRLDRKMEGMRECFSNTFKCEGILSFWKGNTINVIRYFPTQALNFTFRDTFKVAFAVDKEKDGHAKWICANFISGGLAGSCSLPFVYPLDFARTRLANDTISLKNSNERQFKNVLDVFVKTIHSDGVSGLYRGFLLSVNLVFVYRGCYFGMYYSVTPFLPYNTFWLNFLVAWAVTSLAGTAVYPFDTVRRRMMMTTGEAERFRSSFDAFNSIIRNEGMRSLMRGAGVNVVRGVAGAGVLSLVDLLKPYYVYWRLGWSPEEIQRYEASLKV